MVSEYTAISLVNMINIFALAIVLIMAFIVMNDKRAFNKDDEEVIIFRDVYIKTMFVSLLIVTVALFITLPLVSFMFGI